MRTAYLHLLDPQLLESEASWQFATPRPRVRLIKAFETPFANIIATARTCYSSKGIVPDVPIEERHTAFAQDLYMAGHHTTFQHAHFQFSIENVSRQFIWSFFHSHPFYNSEQVSQRYVEVKPDQFVIPNLSSRATQLYVETIENQSRTYRILCEKLEPLVKDLYYKRYKIQGQGTVKHQKNVRKRAMEAARYVLPVATTAYLYHTISGVTLLRYARLALQQDTPSEQWEVIRQMLLEVLKWDPAYAKIMEDPVDYRDVPENRWVGEIDQTTCKRALRFIESYDQSMSGSYASLCDYSQNAEKVLADSVREVMGVPAAELDDDTAIRLALDPSQNNLLGESLNLTTHSKLARALFHPHYTFRKRVSHTADSQDQRHRMTPGSRPVLAAHYTGEPDYIRPPLLELDEEIRNHYDRSMQSTWEAINALLADGVRSEYALYLLPNATVVRFTESADLLNLRHKHAMRLCYNAQEEIWHASVEEARQITAVHPRIGQFLLPPCGHRQLAEVKPFCPEGDRYCGIPVWKLGLNSYERLF